VGCWLGRGEELCILLCPCWRPHQPAGTQAAPPHGAAPRTFSHALITRLLYTQRRMLSVPTFVLHCVCLLICVCVCSFLFLFGRTHPSSHSALHVFQKFTSLMQKWHMAFLDFTMNLNCESKHTSYIFFLRIKRTINRRNSLQNLPLCKKKSIFSFLIYLKSMSQEHRPLKVN
jgi:hypothetical protein